VKINDHKNSNSSSESSLTTFPLNSPGVGNCSDNPEIALFCASRSLGGILSRKIPKCLEEGYKTASKKSASREISILSSLTDSSKTFPFLIPLGDIISHHVPV